MEAFAYLQLELAQEETSELPPDYNLPDLQGLAGNAQLYLVSLISVLLILSTTGETLAQSNNILQEGSVGDEVEQVEFQLKQLGYFKETPDQFFTISTVTAVERFQINYSLGVDGKVGPETRGELNRLTNIPPSSSPDRINRFNTGDTGGVFQVTSPILSPNQGNRAEVRLLQQELARREYYLGNIDGIYGPQTKFAVERFQRENRLRLVDGIAGQETLERLGLRTALTIQNQPYVVVVPGIDELAVDSALGSSEAILARSRRGSYINAGSFTSRNEAESRAYLLKAKGFDARVVYKP